MQYDIAIVGAGPVGLAFAQSMSASNYKIVIIDKQNIDELSNPLFDGREIALTHMSKNILEKIGAWQYIDSDQVSPLKNAKIFNSISLDALQISAQMTKAEHLGYFVSNHLIRKALFDNLKASTNIGILSSTSVTTIKCEDNHRDSFQKLQLSNGQYLLTKLVVAADSKFSQTRQMMGIAANFYDFGRTMMTCRFLHEIEHNQAAWQWFDIGQTIAVLPLNGLRSNIILTLPKNIIQHILSLNDDEFNLEVTKRLQWRLGPMHKDSTVHTYPLVSTYSKRFIAHRCALIGDAAVGMHPITAHGFNFGMQSQQLLANQLLLAQRRHCNLSNYSSLSTYLKKYERQHKVGTWPLYKTTNYIAQLYTNDSFASRLLRSSALKIAKKVQLFPRSLSKHLVGGFKVKNIKTI